MPMLETERLLLRPPGQADMDTIVALIGDYEVSKNLARVPHPYTEVDARQFLDRVAQFLVDGKEHPFGITLKGSGAYIGGCGLHPKGAEVEFGYWLGKPYWGTGYATEAGRALLAFAFDELKLERLVAGYFHDNPASGRVLAKLGCAPAGTEQRDCAARGHAVYSHVVTITNEQFQAARR